MKRLKGLGNNILTILQKNKWLVAVIILLLILLISFITRKNYYYGMLFYTDSSKTKLIAEKRAILREKNKIDRVGKIVEELLLGPIDPSLVNIFPIDSKLISYSLENDTLLLNLDRQTFLSIDYEKENNNLLPYLQLQSIVISVCFNERSIKNVRFYFDGEEYRFIGNYGPITNGVKPDWKILKK